MTEPYRMAEARIATGAWTVDAATNRITNLELVTGSENMRHAFDTGLATATRGTCNPNATLTEEDVVAIRRARADGQPQRVVAERFGIHEEHVGRIARRVAWPHVA